jgi:hypothetical protein
MSASALDVTGAAPPLGGGRSGAGQGSPDAAGGLGQSAAPADRAGGGDGLAELAAQARQAGHELNNKLLLVTGYGELLAERLAGGEHAETMRRIVEAAESAGEVLERLQAIIRQQQRQLLDGGPQGRIEASTTES